MILEDIQKEYGYIPLEVQELVSKLTGVPVSEIYGVVTFYSFFSMTPKGKYIIGVCLGTACYVKGSQLVLDKFSELPGARHVSHTPAACSFPGENARSWEALGEARPGFSTGCLRRDGPDTRWSDRASSGNRDRWHTSCPASECQETS